MYADAVSNRSGSEVVLLFCLRVFESDVHFSGHLMMIGRILFVVGRVGTVWDVYVFFVSSVFCFLWGGVVVFGGWEVFC